jgi:hypothetical protein
MLPSFSIIFQDSVNLRHNFAATLTTAVLLTIILFYASVDSIGATISATVKCADFDASSVADRPRRLADPIRDHQLPKQRIIGYYLSN